MADPRDPITRWGTDLLDGIQALGLCTDDSFATYLRSLGIPCERVTFTNQRRGHRTAPLGLLPLLLHHVDDPGAVLGLLARPHGLRVVEDTEGASAGTTTALMLRAIGEAGRLSAVVSEALADGEISEDERRAVEERLEVAAQTIANLRAQLAAPRPRIAR